LAAIQRRLARDHKAILVPKRAYTEVIGAPGATVDGLHLSQSGQRRMAQMMLHILESKGYD
jgi:lysophospholipase L1-like esterase